MAAGIVQRVIRTLKSSGSRETARRAVLHVTRKISERRYVRTMMPSPEELTRQRAETFPRPVRFSLIVPLYNTPEKLLRETIQSVLDQSYQDWELCLADGSDEAHAEVGAFCRQLAARDPRIRYQKLEKNLGISGNSNAALSMADGNYIVLFDHDDLLMPNALYEVAKAIHQHGADFIYSDELIFKSPHPRRVIGIRFKPDFVPEDLLTNNYICHLSAFSKELLDRVGPFRSEFDGSQDHDLVLRLTGAAKKVVHIPRVLYLWRSIPGSVASDIHMKEYAITAGQNAVRAFLRQREGREIPVSSTTVFPTMYRVDYPLEGAPSVRVLVAGSAAEERFLRLKRSTTWSNVQFELIGGGSRRNPQRSVKGTGQAAGPPSQAPSPETEEESGRPFLSRRLQTAAQAAGEDYLVFLNGMPEVVTPDWIQEMLRFAQRPEIGAVGIRVQFEKENLRHAGIILGLGPERIAGRPYYNRYDDRVGFFGQLAVVRQVSAVTDCWMVRRDLFLQSGGFDPAYQDALYDIDFCLKLLDRGCRNLWIPDACLKMGKAKDLRMDVGAEQPTYAHDKTVFREKWASRLEAGDPCYNPNLSLDHEDWRIK